MNAELAIITPTEIVTLSSLEMQLVTIKKTNAEFVFDYADKDGNKAARSHIYKLRETKAAIEKAAKAEREDAIAHQKRVIAKEKELVAVVVEMIEVHDAPLREYEAKEEARRAAIQERIAMMRPTSEVLATASALALRTMLADLETLDTTTGFDELSHDAFAARVVSIDLLRPAIAAAEKREQDAADLERLRAEAEARRIADEAAEVERLRVAMEEAAKVEAARLAEEKRAADEKAKAEEAERIAEALRKQAEKAEADRLAIIAQAERDRDMAAQAAQKALQEAEARQEAALAAERKRVADEQAAKEAEEARKMADLEHRRTVHKAIVAAMIKVGVVSEDEAKAIVVGICGDLIPHLKIVY